MKWYEVKTYGDCQIDYVYDEDVDKLMRYYRDQELEALKQDNILALETIRKQILNLMQMAAPQIVIRKPKDN